MKNNSESSFKDIIVTISNHKNELKKRLFFIFSIAIIFSLLGFWFSKLQEKQYVAVLSFIVEDQSEATDFSSFSGMANLAGFNLGGNTSSSFSQQNIIELLKSRKIIEKTLNHKCEISGKSDLLLNHYIRINSFINDSSITNLSTNYNDSIINVVWSRIINEEMNILFQNNEANILNLSFESLNAEFAKNFTEIIISEISEMYSDYQTEKTRIALNNLETRSDSIFSELKSAERSLARVKDKNTRVITSSGRLHEIQYMREVEVLNAIYIELRKNIEITNMNLLDETPLVQIIDKPFLPLNITNRSTLFWIVIFSFLGVFITVFMIISRKLVRDTLREDI